MHGIIYAQFFGLWILLNLAEACEDFCNIPISVNATIGIDEVVLFKCRANATSLKWEVIPQDVTFTENTILDGGIYESNLTILVTEDAKEITTKCCIYNRGLGSLCRNATVILLANESAG